MAKSKLRDLSEKRRKLGNGSEQNASTTTAATPADVDRISDLPDCLLCHILSFLPTTTSVATSLLSRRWRRLWQHLQAFDFNCDPFLRRGQLSQENANMRLFAFVNAVLARRTSRDIRKFRLTCCATESDKTATIDTWIRAAVGPHLEELRLDLSVFSWDWVLPVPPNLFSCTALVTLILGRMMVTVEPNQRSSFYLPSLKNLELHLESTDNVDALLSGCPVLEKLSLTFYGRRSPASAAKIIRVPSSLKSLSIKDFTLCGIEELEIDTPSLECLCISAAGDQQQLSVRNLHSVVDASLELCQPESLLKLLRELRNARHLRMWPVTVSCLLRAPLDLPEFECLVQLRLTLPHFDTMFVMNMLEKCHMLQVLRIDKSEDAARRRDWKLPINVPSCLVSHLSRITFSKYHGSEDDREFIAYILREGLVLESVQIYVDWWEKLRIQEELSLTSRGSNMCQLYIYVTANYYRPDLKKAECCQQKPHSC